MLTAVQNGWLLPGSPSSPRPRCEDEFTRAEAPPTLTHSVCVNSKRADVIYLPQRTGGKTHENAQQQSALMKEDKDPPNQTAAWAVFSLLTGFLLRAQLLQPAFTQV